MRTLLRILFMMGMIGPAFAQGPHGGALVSTESKRVKIEYVGTENYFTMYFFTPSIQPLTPNLDVKIRKITYEISPPPTLQHFKRRIRAAHGLEHFSGQVLLPTGTTGYTVTVMFFYQNTYETVSMPVTFPKPLSMPSNVIAPIPVQ